jgi:uroporphyrinogen-III decarboxylase
MGEELPKPERHGAPLIQSRQDFEGILPKLFTDSSINRFHEWLIKEKPEHDRGETCIWYTLEGFFWFPRTLFGIENHLYAFYDEPDLMTEMNKRAVAYYEKVLEMIGEILAPEFMTIAEDMSYNHGPMISKDLFDEFVLPYYRRIIPMIKAQGTKVIIDTDGFVEPMIDWLAEGGAQGVLPLERQAGVDVNRIRRNHPDLIMIGGFDKTVMHLGEDAMRQEFERLLPAMASGWYIPGVDHQTPPSVKMADYRLYLTLLREYASKACLS